MQQLRKTFPKPGGHRYVTLDRDSEFDTDVLAFLEATGLQPKRTSIRSPWQNGVGERCVGVVGVSYWTTSSPSTKSICG